MDPVTFFEIPSKDTKKTRSFYNAVFGWNFGEASDEYWLMNNENSEKGIDGAIMKRNHPDQPVTITIEVKNLDKTINKIESNGGNIAVPKMAISGFGWAVFFKDPDNNIIGAFEPDPNAE